MISMTQTLQPGRDPRSGQPRLGLFREGDLIRCERVPPIRQEAEKNGWQFELRDDGDYILRRAVS